MPTENQKKIIRVLKWIIYPFAAFLIYHEIKSVQNLDPLNSSEESTSLFEWVDRVLFYLVFLVVGVGVLALIQHYFFGPKSTQKSTAFAEKAPLLLRVDMKNQPAVHAALFVVALGFCALLNGLLFSPEMIVDEGTLREISLTEKIVFGFFYVVAHFLLMVFGRRLFEGMPPLFIATEKGFCYEPAGISTGWILWEDVVEVRESAVLYGSGVNNGPTLHPVLGIKLANPEEYNAAAFAPLLQKLVSLGQKLNNYQTEGVGDVLIIPEDFGKEY
ncbi:MAG: hypothetical protein LPK45_06230 [Bacteroidota bacterium]|nr:hypothetical protein [Bacteroidota bacterium]MDX5430670.1 hypothetical protein [Bacteroidota bacterium]MDX5469417.1 hypothetical protein [Bacteroidota bacterium]